MQISTILSDYDGTLSPTAYLNSNKKNGRRTNYRNQIELDRILWEISGRRTIAIVSTKDFNFLQNRTRFARIVSCMMSIETIVLKQDDSTISHRNSSIQNCIENTS